MFRGYYQKRQRKAKKKNIKTKKCNIPVNNIEIFLKEKNPKSVSMVVNEIKNLLEDE